MQPIEDHLPFCGNTQFPCPFGDVGSINGIRLHQQDAGDISQMLVRSAFLKKSSRDTFRGSVTETTGGFP